MFCLVFGVSLITIICLPSLMDYRTRFPGINGGYPVEIVKTSSSPLQQELLKWSIAASCLGKRHKTSRSETKGFDIIVGPRL